MSETPPIEEQEFLSGMKVVNIEDLRIARGLSKRPRSSCPHINLVYDARERRVWCKGCRCDVDAFDAFLLLAERAYAYSTHLDERKAAIEEAENHALFSLAAKAVDEVWRTKREVPRCPSCGDGLLPEDFKHGCKTVPAFWERKRREKKEGRQK